ncbi:hypothetical protein D3C76_1337520 [compost metagenome]
MGDAAPGLLPDFRAGGGVVRIRVIGVVELIQQPAFAPVRHLEGQIAGPFHPLLFTDQN